MRTLDPAFAAHLRTGATTLATCWLVRRADGAALGFTDHDRALAFDGRVFEPQSGASGAALEATSDLAVDNTEIAGALTSDRLSAADLARGAYDGASVEIWRVNWRAPAERMLLRRGVIGDVTRRGEAFTAEIRGASAGLDRVEGRVFQRLCDATLGDARCGVDIDAPALRGAGVVIAAAGAEGFTASGLGAFAARWFEHGRLDWTHGANAGARGWVKTHGAGAGGTAIALWTPAGAPIAPGDRFDIRAGCDRARATCRGKFDNLVNFRGFPDMPGNDAAISYPVKSDRNDGGRR